LKDLNELLGNSFSDEAIAELMLARSALEQKNETIDAKDAAIRDLLRKNRALERELEEARRAVPAAANTGGHTGVESLIEDVVRLLVKHEMAPAASALGGDTPAAGLEGEIVELLRDRWGLEVFDGEPSAIDPYIHRVIEVVKGPGDGEKSPPGRGA
jgi:hypothetical protein